MLNYDIVTGENQHYNDTTNNSEVELLMNPFPGLRPFTIEESHLFFGREGQVDEILEKLSKNRFITVIGYSGSGKSSLMHCGLIPVLYGGFIPSVGANWNIITTRPGTAPFQNLAESIIQSQSNYHQLNEAERTLNATVISSILKSSSNGLLDAIGKVKGNTGSTLLLVDQFEELFRFVDSKESSTSFDEANAYVQMVIQAIEQTSQPIYVALTLRSDFIGRCADYQGLTDKINDSNYLVPQMSRDQKKLVIEGPVAVGGGEITPRLVKRLLNDVTDHQDQLPILQHAMMRTWSYWLQNKEQNEPLDIRHYQSVGGISEALSQHADEAYDELDVRQKEIAEVLFKTLTVRTSENYGIRRSAKISVVSEIAGASEEEVIAVIEEFRIPGRSFLMPSPQVALRGDTNIEISHESLMRIWTRLKSWVDEEYESAQMYKRLSEAAAMYQIGKTGLWRPPDLQLALNWQKKQRPTRAWAQRYDEAFERAIVFLDTSRITYEAEQKNQEMVQKRLLRRTKIVAVVLGAAAVISILFFIYAITQQFKAQKEAQIARKAELEAIASAKQATEASEREQEKSRQLGIAYEQLEDSAAVLARQRSRLQNILFDLQIAEQKASEEAEEAIIQSKLAVANERIAKANEIAANRNYEKASQLLGLSVAQTMAIKSQFIEEPDLRLVVAQQAFKFHFENNGRVNDPYIYNALHNAVDIQNDDTYNTGNISTDAIRSIDYGEQFIYATGSDGNVYKINKNKFSDKEILHTNNFPNKLVTLSPDQQWLVVASDSSFLQVFSTDGSNKRRISGHKTFVQDISFIPKTLKFYSLGADGEVRLNNLETGQSTLFKKLDYPARSMAISPSGTTIALGTDNSKVYLLDVSTGNDEQIITKGKNNPAHTLTFHPNGNTLAIGYEKGTTDLFDMNTKTIIKELYGHTSKVNKIAFSPDGKYLATGSFDRKIYLWVFNELDELPTILEDHNGFVWDIDFANDNNYLVAGIGSGNIKVWPTRPELMSENICNLIFRNMTPEEWKTFVGTEIEYEKTCENLPDMF